MIASESRPKYSRFFGGRDYVRAVRLRLVLRPALRSFHRQLQSLGKERVLLLRCLPEYRTIRFTVDRSTRFGRADKFEKQNPEKLQARWSQTYSAQRPLSENVPQPVEHRCPV